MTDIAGVAVKPHECALSLWMGNKPAVQSNVVCGIEIDFLKGEAGGMRIVGDVSARMKNKFIFDAAGREEN